MPDYLPRFSLFFASWSLDNLDFVRKSALASGLLATDFLEKLYDGKWIFAKNRSIQRAWVWRRRFIYFTFASRLCFLLETVSDFPIFWISIIFGEFKFQIHSERSIVDETLESFLQTSRNLHEIQIYLPAETTSNQPRKNIYRWSWIPTNFWLIAFVTKFHQQNNFITKLFPIQPFLLRPSLLKLFFPQNYSLNKHLFGCTTSLRTWIISPTN